MAAPSPDGFATAMPLFEHTGLSPRIDPTGFTVGIFTLLGVSILTIIGRLTLRLQRTKRLEVDDYFLITALLLLVSAVAVQQHYRDLTYMTLNVELGNLQPSEDFFEGAPLETKVLTVGSVLLWASIFSIKFSFLFFFRKLIDRVRVLKIYWWVVFGVVLPCALVCVPLGFVECAYFGQDFIEHCPPDQLIAREHIYLNVTIVLDILTDVLIVSLPVALLWNVKIKLVKKLTLLSMFGLSFVMIIVAIIRVTKAPLTSRIIDTTWLFFWQIMEASIALLMVSVSAFKGLFGQANHNSYRAKGKNFVSGTSECEESDLSGQPAPGQNLKSLISSPKSPKTLASFDPTHIQLEPAGPKANATTMSSRRTSCSSKGGIDIELAAIFPTPPQSRGQSRTRDIGDEEFTKFTYRETDRSKELPLSPPRGPTHGFDHGTVPGSPAGTTSAYVWSDNDKRMRPGSRSSPWETAKMVLGDRTKSSRSNSRAGSRDASRDNRHRTRATLEQGQSEPDLADITTESAGIRRQHESDMQDTSGMIHDRSRNGSGSTTAAATLGYTRSMPHETV